MVGNLDASAVNFNYGLGLGFLKSSMVILVL